MKDKTKRFGNMTPDELEAWEKKADGIILLDDESGISFQKTTSDEGDEALIIQVDGIKNPIMLDWITAPILKKYMNEKFQSDAKVVPISANKTNERKNDTCEPVKTGNITSAVTIKTDGDLRLFTQEVIPTVVGVKVKTFLPKQMCLVIEGPLFYEEDIIDLCEPVFLDREGAQQLYNELHEFLTIPF